MELRIIFCEPHAENTHILPGAVEPGEQWVIIDSPYAIRQTKISETRTYIGYNNIPAAFTYEQYIKELTQLITHTINQQNLSDGYYEKIAIEGFKDPNNFQTVCVALAKQPINCTSDCQLEFKNCSFHGRLYAIAATQLIQSLQRHNANAHNEPLALEIVLADSDNIYYSRHDEVRLLTFNNLLGNLEMRREGDHSYHYFLSPFQGDTVLNLRDKIKTTHISPLESSLRSKLEAPTFFNLNPNNLENQTASARLLSFFTSLEFQQEHDYTCGPAAIRMIAQYFDALKYYRFCGEPQNLSVWEKIIHMPEALLARQLNTTEAEGSNIPDMRNKLIELGATVFDDNGLSNQVYDEATLMRHKRLVWEKIDQIIKLGIPVILNMQESGGCGHFEVAFGMSEAFILLADPGMAIGHLSLTIERLEREHFIRDRWLNMSKEFHGRFMICSPNEASTHRIALILQGIAHYENGIYTPASKLTAFSSPNPGI